MSDCSAVRRALREHGLLLMQDKQVTSVIGIMTGQSLSGSWWSHPRSHEIFRCLNHLGDDPDVLVCRLMAGKVTFVERTLWPPFLAVAQSGEPWQTRGLSAAARALLRRVKSGTAVRAAGAPVRELQERLLVAAEEVHTESGHHEMVLQTWATWAADRNVGERPHAARPEVLRRPSAAQDDKAQLERAAESIGAASRSLPWRRFARS